MNLIDAPAAGRGFVRPRYTLRWIARCTALIALTGLPLPAAADQFLPEWRDRDPRLQQPVSVQAQRVSVGELVGRLASQSRVGLFVGGSDGAADQEVAVFLRDVPLADALDGLWALVSYRGALWRWERTGQAGHYTYTLRRPLAARNLGQRLREKAQQAFEASASALIRAARMAPEERKAFVGELSRAMLQDDDSVARSLLTSDRLWGGLNVFADLDKDLQTRVLKGHVMTQIPLSGLPETARAWVRSVWEPETVNWSARPMDGPRYIVLHLSPGGDGDVTPTLFIEIDGIGGYAYVGGLPLSRGFRKLISSLWRLPGDSDDHVLSGAQVGRSDTPQGVPYSRGLLAGRLQALAEGTPVSLMARLTDGQIDVASPEGKTVRAYLDLLARDRPGIDHKWRGDMLLISDPKWIWKEPASVPWEVVRYLREAEDRQSGLLTLENLVHAAGHLNSEQMRHLSEDFPVVGVFADWRDVFAACERSPELLGRLRSKDGMKLSLRLRTELESNPRISPYLHREGPIAVRVIDEVGVANEGRRRIVIGFVTRDKPWVPLRGYSFPPRPSRNQ